MTPRGRRRGSPVFSTLAMSIAVTLSVAGPGLAACREDVAELRWEGGQVRFSVEIADDGAERGQGLMNRETLPAGAGMLFVYEEPGPVAFWMKNTLIPLDIIFMDPEGRVTRIQENAQPLDETPIPGGYRVQLVLEINGGLARRLGLRTGAELRHPAVDQTRALWSCDAP